MNARQRAERRLARAMIEHRPEAAAAVLEAGSPEEAARALSDAPTPAAAEALGWMMPVHAASTLLRMPGEEAPRLLAVLEPRQAAAILRRLPPDARERLVAQLPPERARALQALLEFPEGTAGAMMDPQVATLPPDLVVGEARGRVMRNPGGAHYNVYVVERDGTLVGVINLRELIASGQDLTVGVVMREATHRLSAHATGLEVIAHPGWKHVHSLPVVDGDGRYLGAIRFRTMRELEERLMPGPPGATASTGQALGELYWAGITGMADAVLEALAPARVPDDREGGR